MKNRPTETAKVLQDNLKHCTLCPRRCGVNRLAGQKGYCRTGAQPVISSFGPHFGEERVLVGHGGSGTVFFTGCNLRCVYCQNYDISQLHQGEEITIEALAEIFLRLQARGCVNINLVTPTHQIAAIVPALLKAKHEGLHLPIVYNTGGYDLPEMPAMLDGLIDIYMPDMKYADSSTAARYSDAPDYPRVNQAAVRQMHRQVGDLVIENGLAVRGLLIRHLVLPGGLAGSEQIFDFLAEQISPHTAVNVMDQYHPCFRADEYPPLNRRPAKSEYETAIAHARRKGLRLIQ
ncbi:MAG TPA: radical SAM protein [Anaerohalosphaeraceae bacterium]|nr:radical SAM protein [Anaerohalosphaeraceae bacterium]HOL88736.1 radical SAM protein [Anaerohalosphaeraceae bacterium]HPP55921.1 radical SAM protein [Anaerohalosphaeraceae bacterium]